MFTPGSLRPVRYTRVDSRDDEAAPPRSAITGRRYLGFALVLFLTVSALLLLRGVNKEGFGGPSRDPSTKNIQNALDAQGKGSLRDAREKILVVPEPPKACQSSGPDLQAGAVCSAHCDCAEDLLCLSATQDAPEKKCKRSVPSEEVSEAPDEATAGRRSQFHPGLAVAANTPNPSPAPLRVEPHDNLRIEIPNPPLRVTKPSRGGRADRRHEVPEPFRSQSSSPSPPSHSPSPSALPTFTGFRAELRDTLEWFDPAARNFSYEIISSSPGTYNGCQGPMLWVMMGGHLRTADQHVNNTKAFLEQSNNCYFIVYVVRHYIAEGSTGYNHKFRKDSREADMWRTVNVTARLEYIKDEIGDNVAYVVTRAKRRRGWAHTDTFTIGKNATMALVKHHKIKRHRRDMVVLTRPDIVMGQAIDGPQLARIPRNYVLNIAHSAGSPGVGNDPSELFLITSMDVWWSNPNCAGGLLGFEVTHRCDGVGGYITAAFDVHAHRLGRTIDEVTHERTCLNAPCQKMDLNGVSSVLDVTKKVMRAYDGKHLKVRDLQRRKAISWQYVEPVRTNLLLDADPATAPDGRHEKILNVEMVWHSPSTPIKGVVLALHGCSHGGFDFGYPSPFSCPECKGLPEEMAIVQATLKRQLAVVALTSKDRVSGCWSVASDLERTVAALDALRKREGWTALPTYAIGASSGGTMAVHLAASHRARKVLKLQAANSIVAAAYSPAISVPVVYTVMARDSQSVEAATQHAQNLTKANIESKVISLEPKVINGSNYFSERIPYLSTKDSQELVQALQLAGFLDAGTARITATATLLPTSPSPVPLPPPPAGYLREDPRQSDWRRVMPVNSTGYKQWSKRSIDTLIADESPISEVLNVAYGMHEMTSARINTVLDFFEGHKIVKSGQKHRIEVPEVRSVSQATPRLATTTSKARASATSGSASAATRDDDWPTEAMDPTTAAANANANANARAVFDAVDRLGLTWLTIGIPTAPRPNHVNYLTATIDALLAELPDDDASVYFGKTRVVVMNAAGAGPGKHRAFEKVRDAVVALASRATESEPPPGARAALHVTFFDVPLNAHPDPTPNATDPDDLNNSTNRPGRAVRKQTSDVVSLLDAVVGVGDGGGSRVVPPLVPPSPLFMFMEDDFKMCEGALKGLRYLVQKTRTVYPGWLGLRTSYGLNGVVVRAEDVPGFREYLLKHQARQPPDLLWREWIEGARADVRERTNARKLIVYRYNLFEHRGAVSTFAIRPRRLNWPGCYAPLSSAWSLQAVEKFDELQCAKIGDLSPCTGDVDMGKWTGKTPKLPWVKSGRRRR